MKIPEGFAILFPMLHRYLLFIFVLFFGESRQFPGAGSSIRSVAGLEDVLDESCGGDVEHNLVPEFDFPGTTRGTKFSSCIGSSSLVWSGVAKDRWPAHKFFSVRRRAFQVIELLACHREFAPSRSAQDRERTLVLPRLFALLHWSLPPLWDSWISAEFPFRVSLNHFNTACVLGVLAPK